jgi:hypothetical protein
MLKKIIVIAGIVLAVLIAIPVGIAGYLRLTYYDELKSIKKKLNAIPNVSVVNIWGYDDITLEEVTARLQIKDKGEIVLYGLSNDVYNYPDSVIISEIGGYSFKVFYQTGGFGFDIDIGKEGHLGKFFPFELRNEEELIRRYDDILKIIRSWPIFPELYHLYSDGGEEFFLAVIPQQQQDRDPIYNLSGVGALAEFARTLPWDTEYKY